MTEAIRIQNLTKKYKDVAAVDNLTLSIAQGELFALLGVNGAGKTTTIKMLSCLISPSDGDAFVMGNSIVTAASSVKATIGISPQETAVATNLSVLENLEFMCGIYNYSKSKTKEKVSSLVNMFDLTQILHKRAGKLSGGWQRRLSLAMALVGEPRVLFLDEPTLGLDVIARRELWDNIRALKGSVTIILTTHYMEEAEELADRIGIMKNGNLVALGTVDTLKNQAQAKKFEDAFVSIIRGSEACG